MTPLTTPLTKAERTDRIRDPVSFQQRILGRRLTSQQQQIARSAATNRATAVKGCHGSGKTFVVSGCVLHHLAVHPQGKVFTIAPTLRQVKLMWEEIEIARRTSAIAFPQCSTTGLRITEERYGLGFSSSKGVNAQGMHGLDVLIIKDESPGISPEVGDAIEGIRMAGRVRVLDLGNPTMPTGQFYDNFTKNRGSVECITISAFDTPNLQHPAGRPFTIAELEAMSEDELNTAPFPGLVSRFGVLDRYRRWGPNNPRYISRVLGQFPTQSQWAVFDLSWIERAKREPTEAELARTEGCVIQVGIDVAAGGDDETAAVARVNGIIIARAAWSIPDPPLTSWLGKLRRQPWQLGPVMMDTVGVGFHLARSIAEQGFEVYGFKSGSAAMDQEQFMNSKAEAYFRLREMYKADYVSHYPSDVVSGVEGGCWDEETSAQLSTIEYKEMLNGKIMIETKDLARKRGVPSPDRAEAEIMAFQRVVPREEGYVIDANPPADWF